MWKNAGVYAKGIVFAASAVVAALQPYYGSKPWFVGLIAGLGAIGGILIPNAQKQ